MTKLPVPPRRNPFQRNLPAIKYPMGGGEGPGALRVDEPADKTGTLVGVRPQPDLLARLDKARGGLTRPQKIREILEKELPE